MLTALKSRLLEAGHDSRVLFEAFRLQAAAHGIWVVRRGGMISMTRGHRRILFDVKDAIAVPMLVHQWAAFFAMLEGETRQGYQVLDFSKPSLQRYRSGLCFEMASIAEEESMDPYTHAYHPRPGDVVWDVGAYCGLTAYFFAQMVGQEGIVYAFEPDEENYEFLIRNLKRHGLGNVIPVKAALADSTGTASFSMEGSMGSGLSEFLPANDPARNKLVETIGFQDACERFGGAPDYIKMDIEGGELSVVAGALNFLRDHPVHLAIESNHWVNGRFTAEPLEGMLRRASYRAWSSREFGLLFTWAEPASSTSDRSSEGPATDGVRCKNA